MKKAFTFLSIAFLILSCGSSQNNTATQNTEVKKAPADVTEYAKTISVEDLKKDLYIYASDEFEGRETGSPGQKKAIEFLKDRYVKLNIPSPITEGDYYQEVPLQIAELPKLNFEIDGDSYTYVDDIISVSSGKNAIFTADEVIYAGYGIEDDSFSSYSDLNVKGKVVLIKAGEPKGEDGNYIISGNSEASKWSNFRQEFYAKKDVASKKGVKALLFYNPDFYKMIAQRYGRSKGRMALKGVEEDMLYFLVDTKIASNLVTDIADNSESKSVSKKVHIDFQKAGSDFYSENVLALIKGSEKPKEVIVISAHLDHEGIKDGKIYNGADDDGSGSVALLEIAEAFQTAVNNGHGPKRSILLLHVTGEEKGLLGSRYYTDSDPVIPLENTVANLNIDMIGRIDPKHEDKGNYLYLIGADKLSTELHNISEEVNKKYFNMEFDYTYNDDNDPNRFYYRSDHYNFAKNNIPVIFYFNGTHADYHKPSDTVEKIEYDFLAERTRLIFHTAWELANRENRIVVDKATE